ncbi:MAG TPA: putative quinol monooxygenase [Smithellaceae bacterium]|jgi:quinol monooxygenase YgiN|nr:antibiotic biosynthesis monooxygenase [Syntrophaceae bacterium]HPL97439.1 putative quinol monooxygenase [Smithellaceae bacterium]HPV49376.1 putative quinol monooxygenase [Smithellaceae bacterium]
MLTVIAKIPIKEGKMDEALKAFGELMVKVSGEEGTMMYSLNRDRAVANTLVVIEQYKDKEAFDFHVSTDYFKEFFTVSAAFIGGRPEMSVMEEIKSI